MFAEARYRRCLNLGGAIFEGSLAQVQSTRRIEPVHDLQLPSILFLSFEVEVGLKPRNNSRPEPGENFLRNQIGHFCIVIPQSFDCWINQSKVIESAAFAGGLNNLEASPAGVGKR